MMNIDYLMLALLFWSGIDTAVGASNYMKEKSFKPAYASFFICIASFYFFFDRFFNLIAK